MDNTAIEAIEALIHAANAQRVGDKHQAILVPKNYQLASIEQFLNTPSRFRAHYSTDRLGDFVKYVDKYRWEDDEHQQAIFVNPDNLQAHAFFDLGSPAAPAHRDHTATLTAGTTVEYDALLAVNGKKLSQSEAVEWLEDWIHCIDTQSNGSPTLATAIKRLKVKHLSERDQVITGFKTERTAMEQIEAVSDGAAELPDMFWFECVPSTFDETMKQRFPFRLRITAEKDAITVSFRCTVMKQIQNVIHERFKTAIAESIKNTPIYIGGLN